MVVINESGLYDMIFESRLSKARDFRHWVTSTVLQELRKNGSYSIEQKPDSYTISDPVERARRWHDLYSRGYNMRYIQHISYI